MDSQTILLVDDNQTHRYSLGKHLDESGFVVLQAETGTQALDLAKSNHIDAILLDIHLPDLSGFEVGQRLKKDPATKEIPIIFHSATYDTQSAKSQAMDIGAASFLSYPITIDHLLRVLQGAFLKSEAGTPHS